MKKQLLIIFVPFALFIIFYISFQNQKSGNIKPINNEQISKSGVCPPFYLYDEAGNVINPATGENVDKPYSPRRTCGKCHNYEKITQGFHFQQGKDEGPDSLQKTRAHWVSHAGNYGGNWCSPAPLYSYLSPKNNENEKLIDMTSYSFVQKCGVCHPGGGSMEYDRENKRFDAVMADTSMGFTDGGLNKLDGDYYKANWAASGVIEADCYLCHLPGYSNKKRVGQIQKLNYRYAALAGSGFGEVSGSVADNQPITVSYNTSMFNADGTVEPTIVKEPRNTACLWCHAKPGYKKRGADFSERNDVHLRAGLKCVDCHPTGSMATDERIRGKEVHQFGKGDDPGGIVRNDLDNTMRTCADCHNTGYLGAPLAKHDWLPPLHLETIACQTCHIPERNVKAVQYVASDVFNPGTKIPTKGKYLWTFYGPDMNYWNHYGDLQMMGYDDKPTFNFRPDLVKYKGQIFPANRVHSSWPAIQIEGQQGLMQPKMSDIYKMWDLHRKDPGKYPELSKIIDNSGDSLFEVNTPEEIDALIASITDFLNDFNYPMDGKHVVWVMNDRVYSSGNQFYQLPMKEWEASAYANVHKYSHDIKPAKSALGSKSCTECHAFNSDFLFAQTLKYPFGEDGKPVTQPQYKLLGISGFMAYTGAFRESILKPLVYFGIAAFIIILLSGILVSGLVKNNIISDKQRNMLSWALSLLVLGAGFFGFFAGDLGNYMFPTRMFLDANHFIISVLVLLTGGWFFLRYHYAKDKGIKINILSSLIFITILSGIFMMLKFDFIKPLNSFAYTLYDISLLGLLVSCIFYLDKYFGPEEQAKA